MGDNENHTISSRILIGYFTARWWEKLRSSTRIGFLRKTQVAIGQLEQLEYI